MSQPFDGTSIMAYPETFVQREQYRIYVRDHPPYFTRLVRLSYLAPTSPKPSSTVVSPPI